MANEVPHSCGGTPKSEHFLVSALTLDHPTIPLGGINDLLSDLQFPTIMFNRGRIVQTASNAASEGTRRHLDAPNAVLDDFISAHSYRSVHRM